MRKFLLTTLFLLAILINPVYMYAQENVLAETDGNTFEINIVPGIQSIFDKSIPLKLNIKSNVDTQRMQIRWELPIGIESKGSYTTNWGEISKDQSVSTLITLKPSKPGTYNVIAEVQDWTTNEVDTISIKITFDNNLELAPQSEEYYRNQKSWFWAKVGIGTTISIILLILGWFGLKSFRKWMDED